MKVVSWILLGCRALTLIFGLTCLVAGCGDSSATSEGVTAKDEMNKMEDTKKAMDAASKTKKK